MGKYSKWIGGGIGLMTGGYIGAVIGFLLGSALDGAGSPSSRPSGRSSKSMERDQFLVSLTILSTAILKADGKVLKVELEYVKQFLLKSFGVAKTNEALQMIKELLEKDIDEVRVARELSGIIGYSSKVQLLYFMFGLASSDGNVDNIELEMIQRIAFSMGVSSADFNSVKSMYVSNKSWAYDILGIEESATDDEVKKAYKKMAILHHPDKVGNLGEDIQKSAKEKFQKINEAYSELKKLRSIK